LGQQCEQAGDGVSRCCRRVLEQRLPGCDVVGDPCHGLEFCWFEGCAGNLGFVGELGRVEEAAQWDGCAGIEQGPEFGDELVLLLDPRLVC